MSEIYKKIDEVIKLGLASFMKSEGFKKSARNWHKQEGDNWLVVNVQSSSGNIGAEGAFTINLGVYNAEISSLAGKAPLTGKPKEYEATVRERVGVLAHGVDHWWKIEKESELSHIAQEVVDEMKNYGVPWLNTHQSVSAIAESLEQQPSLESLSAAFLSGGEAAAILRLKKAIESRPRAKDRYVSWAKKVGLNNDLG